jgi:hypothetical protein
MVIVAVAAVVVVIVVVGRVVNQSRRGENRLLTTRVIGWASLLTKSRDRSTIQLIVLGKGIPKLMKRTLRWINLQVLLNTPQAAIILLGLVTKRLPKLPQRILDDTSTTPLMLRGGASRSSGGTTMVSTAGGRRSSGGEKEVAPSASEMGAR